MKKSSNIFMRVTIGLGNELLCKKILINGREYRSKTNFPKTPHWFQFKRPPKTKLTIEDFRLVYEF